jgi:hypothetical protein
MRTTHRPETWSSLISCWRKRLSLTNPLSASESSFGRVRHSRNGWHAMAVIVSVCFRVPAAHLVGHLRHPDFVVFLRFGFS